jgi:cytochrome o ubiquinol oxidase subunit IV
MRQCWTMVMPTGHRVPPRRPGTGPAALPLSASSSIALVVLAVAQMGIHLVFFLHITTSPDNTNNVLALAFGVLIVFVLVFGTVWAMAHMNANMMPPMG